jgi:outer membrane lipoprotein-sorting protein
MRKIATGVGVGVIIVFAIILALRAGEGAAKPLDVLDRAIKAHGGADNLKKLQGSFAKSKGKFHGLGEAVDYNGETSIQLPDRFRMEVQSKFGDQDFKFIQVINGDKGWVKINDKTEEMNKDQLAEAKEQRNVASITHLTPLTGKDYKLSPLGEVKVGDRAAIGVRVERKGYRDVSLFFDKDKGLLIKMETRGKDAMRGDEEYTAVTLYDDYKKIDDMMVAHKVTIKHDDKLFVEGETTEVKLSEKLDDSLFEKP